MCLSVRFCTCDSCDGLDSHTATLNIQSAASKSKFANTGAERNGTTALMKTGASTAKHDYNSKQHCNTSRPQGLNMHPQHQLPPRVILKYKKRGWNLHNSQAGSRSSNQCISAAHLSSSNLEVVLQLMAFFHPNPPWLGQTKKNGSHGDNWRRVGKSLGLVFDMWSGFGSYERDMIVNLFNKLCGSQILLIEIRSQIHSLHFKIHWKRCGFSAHTCVHIIYIYIYK